jgi:hypothetical protein
MLLVNRRERRVRAEVYKSGVDQSQRWKKKRLSEWRNLGEALEWGERC